MEENETTNDDHLTDIGRSEVMLTFLTTDQRAELIEQCLDWFEDWKDSDPTCYPETREEKKQMMVVLNNRP